MVSVIMPTYNRASTIKRAVDSILNQTYTDFELIIVDDGSIDNTKDIVKAINDKRIKYLYQDNMGAGAARNRGIEIAQGEYIAFHDSDDVCYKDKLMEQVNIAKNTGSDMIFTGYLEVSNVGKQNGPIGLKPGFQNELRNEYGIAFVTLFGKSEIFKENMFDECLPRLQDFELVYRLCAKCRFYYLDKVLYEYDNWGDNITGSPSKLVNACEYILVKHPDIIENKILTKKMSDELMNGAYLLKNDRSQMARKAVLIALKYRTSLKNIFKGVFILLNLYRVYLHIRYKDISR